MLPSSLVSPYCPNVVHDGKGRHWLPLHSDRCQIHPPSLSRLHAPTTNSQVQIAPPRTMHIHNASLRARDLKKQVRNLPAFRMHILLHCDSIQARLHGDLREPGAVPFRHKDHRTQAYTRCESTRTRSRYDVDFRAEHSLSWWNIISDHFGNCHGRALVFIRHLFLQLKYPNDAKRSSRRPWIL
jgi:hypothetical protein